MAKNGNRAKRKCHTNFFAFHILDLKIVPNYTELNSAPVNQTHSFKKVGVVPRKAAKLEKVVRNLEKASFDSTKLKTGNWCELIWIYCYLSNGIGLDLELHNSNLVKKYLTDFATNNSNVWFSKHHTLSDLEI